MNCVDARTLLDAYVDGELGIERSLEFDRHLATCPSCAAALASRRALGSALRDKLDYHTAPLSLHRALRDELDRAAAAPSEAASVAWRQTPAWMRMAASLILVAGLSSAITYYEVPRNSDVIPDEVFASHVRGLQSDARLVDVVSSDQHTVKPWLDAKLDFAAPVKDLSRDGFPLVGGRVDYIDEHTVAALIYQSRKHVITLFIWPTDGQAKPIAASVRRGENLAQWSDGTMAYWAISDVAAPELIDFAKRFQAADPLSASPASSTAKGR
jgi:anti-sigma factor RsiW